MTLHEAMAQILREHGGWMARDALAHEIAQRGLYRQRAGGPAPSDQLRLRAHKYNHLFEGSDDRYTRIRMAKPAELARREREPRRPVVGLEPLRPPKDPRRAKRE